MFEKDIIIYERVIKNITMINSTNSSRFMTGILWDTSDANTHYDGTQDLIVITEQNITQ